MFISSSSGLWLVSSALLHKLYSGSALAMSDHGSMNGGDDEYVPALLSFALLPALLELSTAHLTLALPLVLTRAFARHSHYDRNEYVSPPSPHHTRPPTEPALEQQHLHRPPRPGLAQLCAMACRCCSRSRSYCEGRQARAGLSRWPSRPRCRGAAEQAASGAGRSEGGARRGGVHERLRDVDAGGAAGSMSDAGELVVGGRSFLQHRLHAAQSLPPDASLTSPPSPLSPRRTTTTPKRPPSSSTSRRSSAATRLSSRASATATGRRPQRATRSASRRRT